MNEVLKGWNDANAYVKLGKIKGARQNLPFLGMTVSKNGRHIAGKILKTIEEAPRPYNLARLRSFTGLANWHRQLILARSCFR